MSIPTTQRALITKRVKETWAVFKRSKRGVIGSIIVAIFLIVALTGPLLTPHDPVMPVWKGYFPAGSPILADILAVPVWYKYLPGGQSLSENMEVVSDYTFSSDQSLASKWTYTVSDPTIAGPPKYDPAKGTLNDGCVEFSYKRELDDLGEKKANVSLSYDFKYPFSTPPRKFWIHLSYLAYGTLSQSSKATINIVFYRTGSQRLANYTYPEELITQEGSLFTYTYPIDSIVINRPVQNWTSIWLRSTTPVVLNDPKYWLEPEKVIFPYSGDYRFTVEIVFADAGGSAKDVKVYMDNLNVLFYGSAFGLLGSDGNRGRPRDMFTSMVYGARISVAIGLCSALVSVFLGLALGLLAGYSGGWTDEAIMRTADLLIIIPSLPLFIVLAMILSPSVWNIVLILSVMGWMGFSRNVRSVTLSLRERAFIEAAKAAGAGRIRILVRHIFPNVIALVYLALAVSVPGAIVTEASLSWLGLYDPLLITWGRVLNEFSGSGISVLKGFTDYWFWVLPPGIGISALAIAFILMGYALDEIFNPKFRQRR